MMMCSGDKTSLSALSASDVDALSEAYEIPSFFSNLLVSIIR